MGNKELPSAEELFGKHFNGMYHDDLTSEGIQKYAQEYAQLVAEYHVKLALEAASEHFDAYYNKHAILNAYKV